MNKGLNLWLKKAGLLAVGAYRSIGPAIFGGGCRFEPSCSEYAVEALNNHSPGKATLLIGRRVLKCHPFGSHGFDPVPLGGSK